MVSPSSKPSHKNAAAAKIQVRRELWRMCMKNRITSSALSTAIVKAATTFHRPMSNVAAMTVLTSSRHEKAINQQVKWNAIDFVLGLRHVSDQVKKGEEEYPYQIHEMPVQAHDLDRGVFLRGVSAATGFNQEKREQSNADQHVDRMYAGHEEIEDPEQLELRRSLVPPIWEPIAARWRLAEISASG